MMQKIDKTDTLRKILDKQHFTVDYFQREYRWGRKQIEQMIDDFAGAFEECYDPEAHNSLHDVMNYTFYYMGCIICTVGDVKQIIDGQQRLTSLTLLLIYLDHLQKQTIPEEDASRRVPIQDMVYSVQFGTRSFNIDVEDRVDCMNALLKGDRNFEADNESSRNLIERYRDIEEYFPDELKGDALPFFINWLIEKVLLLEIDTGEDEAHTIFLTMNDRGLSLNSAEMMKAYIIQQMDESDRDEANRQWQSNINSIKEAYDSDTSGMVKTQDVDFISTWLRAKYAKTMREKEKGSKDKDYELLGDGFHTWVRDNAHKGMGLVTKEDFKEFVSTDMTQVTELYLRMKEYGEKLTEGFEEVFYNADRNLTYQTMLVIAAVKPDDSKDDVDRKIRMTAKFVDDFATTRILNFKRPNWSTNKSLLFHVMQGIRNADCKTIGMVYVRTLRRMDVSLEGITRFGLNQFSRGYMLHILARFTSYVNEQMGNKSHFDEYVDRENGGNTFDIEHILPDVYEDYKDSFDSEQDFEETRNGIGNLIILTRDKNRSYKDMNYSEKVLRYEGDNILAQSLNDNAYRNNPQFMPVAKEYGLHSFPQFTKESIAERAESYLSMANDIWNPEAIKDLAGGWSDEDEQELFKNEKHQEFTVTYSDRSWPDAVKYGFLSASLNGRGHTIYNVQVGDVVYCYIGGSGFVGIGECLSSAVPMKDFTVDVDGETVPVADAPWIDEDAKLKLDPDREVFIRVKWKKFVPDASDGYWEKGMKALPVVAYTPNDKMTYKKVRKHFGYTEE